MRGARRHAARRRLARLHRRACARTPEVRAVAGELRLPAEVCAEAMAPVLFALPLFTPEIGPNATRARAAAEVAARAAETGAQDKHAAGFSAHGRTAARRRALAADLRALAPRLAGVEVPRFSGLAAFGAPADQLTDLVAALPEGAARAEVAALARAVGEERPEVEMPAGEGPMDGAEIARAVGEEMMRRAGHAEAAAREKIARAPGRGGSVWPARFAAFLVWRCCAAGGIPVTFGTNADAPSTPFARAVRALCAAAKLPGWKGAARHVHRVARDAGPDACACPSVLFEAGSAS